MFGVIAYAVHSLRSLRGVICVANWRICRLKNLDARLLNASGWKYVERARMRIKPES
jgi:hypothetical protein